jgi:hypothetical protein
MPCVVRVSFREGPLGHKSRLADKIGGNPLLWWTLKKAASMKNVSQVFILADGVEARRAVQTAGGLPVEIIEHGVQAGPARRRFIRLRKWALNSWQGGIANASIFGEDLDPAGMLAVAKKTRSDFVMKLSAYGPLADDDFTGKMAEDLDARLPLKLSNSPPGLAAEIYSLDILKKMLNARGGIEGLLQYDLGGLKSAPMPEPSTMAYFALASQDVAFTRTRFLGDTARSFALLESLYEKFGSEWISKGADEIVRAYSADTGLRRWKYPREVEFEISTSATASSPARRALGQRTQAFMEPETLHAALDSLKEADDLCVTLGGYGDPLAHPDLPAILDAAAGAFGIHLHTDGALLDDAKIELLSKSAVDIITVAIDAATEESFKRQRGGGSLAEHTEKMRSLAAACRPDGPFVVPSFTATQSTLAEQEQFFRTWYPDVGWVVAKRLDDIAGLIREDVPLPLTLGKRGICEHLLERLFVHADGRTAACAQDVKCEHPLGGRTPAEAWNSPQMKELISAHERREYGCFAPCARCNRWCSW